MMPRIPSKIWLIAVSLMAALAIAEFVLRCISKEGAPRADSYLGIVMPLGGDWDANGFRNPQALSRADIVAIGDSQTMGRNAAREEAWPLVLGSLASLPVYSMAVVGYGPVQYAQLADRSVLLQPRVVIVGLYLGNDLYDAKALVYASDAWRALRSPRYHDSRATANDATQDMQLITESGERPTRLARWTHAVSNWLRDRSELYVLVGAATKSLRQRTGLSQTTEHRQHNVEQFAKDHPDIAYVYTRHPTLSTTLSPHYRLNAVDLHNPETGEGWRIAQGRLLAIQKRLENAHIQLVILVIPTKEAVYLRYMATENEDIPEVFAVYKTREDETTAAVEGFCAKHGIRRTSALQAMVDALSRGIRIYDETIDGHPQAEGYRVMAGHVYRYLTEQNLLPQRGVEGR